MMTYWRAICMVLLVAVTLLVGVASGQTSVFGPERYVRETGSPTTITKTFSVQRPTGSFTLVVENQGISSAVIELNGVTVVGPNAFNKQVHTISRQVALQPQNTLSVELRSAPGSSVIITVFAPPQTVASALAELEATGQIPTLDRSASILGPDVNGNQVRDDIDHYIDTLPDTAPQKGALRQASKAIDRAMQAGVNSATPSQLRDVDTAIARAVNCIWNRYDATTAPTKVATIEKLTANTRVRFDAYDLYNTKRSGTSSRLPRGETCDTP